MPLNLTISTRAGLILIAVAVLTTVVVKEVISLHRGVRALDDADAHIASIRSPWSEFKAENPGARSVTLISHTQPIGSVMAYGWIPDKETEERIRTFLEGTGPPNGVKMMTIIDPARYSEETLPKNHK